MGTGGNGVLEREIPRIQVERREVNGEPLSLVRKITVTCRGAQSIPCGPSGTIPPAGQVTRRRRAPRTGRRDRIRDQSRTSASGPATLYTRRNFPSSTVYRIGTESGRTKPPVNASMIWSNVRSTGMTAADGGGSRNSGYHPVVNAAVHARICSRLRNRNPPPMPKGPSNVIRRESGFLQREVEKGRSRAVGSFEETLPLPGHGSRTPPCCLTLPAITAAGVVSASAHDGRRVR